ncbi:amelogenin-like [Macrobrachium nipponense]|uniref:amelogenin-like n=1 Tax=Macrobrachium nipponense TaxID=159736 RepID=UPI0030C7F893
MQPEARDRSVPKEIQGKRPHYCLMPHHQQGDLQSTPDSTQECICLLHHELFNLPEIQHLIPNPSPSPYHHIPAPQPPPTPMEIPPTPTPPVVPVLPVEAGTQT